MRKTVYLFSALIAAVLLFTGCENFLDSEGVSDQIKQNIKYANTTPCTIPITTETGSGIITKPAGGEAKVKPSDTFNLAFSAESDHQFLRWEIYDSATGKAIENGTYLKVEDLKMIDTTCNFVKLPENSNIKLAIRAITAVRPQIYFTGPIYEAKGVRRNSTIIVRFDHNMDENSIYYTDEEKNKLKSELGITDTDFLISGEDRGNVCYGYKKDGKKHFKNIQIESDNVPTDWEVQAKGYSRDIYDYYDVPRFIDSSNRILEIPAMPDAPVESFKKITVTIDKNIFYKINSIPISMRESKSWLFALWGDHNASPSINPQSVSNGEYPWIVNEINKPLVYSERYNRNQSQVDFEHPEQNELKPLKLNSTDTTIPQSNNSEKIRLGFAFTAVDSSGSGLTPYFTLVFYNAVQDTQGSTIYKVQIPWRSRKNTLVDNDELQPEAEAGYYLDNDLYWVEIPRNERLSESKIYGFNLYIENHDSKRADLNSNNFAYWINVTTASN